MYIGFHCILQDTDNYNDCLELTIEDGFRNALVVHIYSMTRLVELHLQCKGLNSQYLIVRGYFHAERSVLPFYMSFVTDNAGGIGQMF